MTWVLVLIVVALLVTLATFATVTVGRRRRPEAGRPRRASGARQHVRAPEPGPLPGPHVRAPEPGPLPGPQATIRLDVEAAEPDTPAAERLARQAAARVLRTSPDVDEVIVVDRNGRRLATVERHEQPPSTAPATPEAPPEVGRAERGARGSGRESWPELEPSAPKHAQARPLGDRFELPDVVRAHLRRPEDPVDLVRAILEAASLPVEVQGNVLRCGDEAVIVVREAEASATDVLARAFLRFQQSGASHGVVIYLGYLNPREVERRQALAPNLRYTGSGAIQRMADAVALGGNPLRFATDPSGT